MDKNIEIMMNPNASYRDLIGKAELAWDLERTALLEIAEKSGIDIKLFEPLGLSLHFGGHGFFSFSIFVADKEKSQNGKRRIKQVMAHMSLKEFQKYLNELSINLLPPHTNWERDFYYDGEARVDDL